MPYLFICKLRIERALAYRFDVIINILFQCIVMFASAFFWKALFNGVDSMQGVAANDMLTYTIISAMMSICYYTEVEYRVIYSVRKGNVATDLIKPVNLYGTYFAEDLGNVISRLFQNGIPVMVIGCLFITIPKPKSGIYFLLFLVSFLMGFLINWFFTAIFSMWAFSAINMDPMVQVKKHVVRLLSGSIIPMWFFPNWLSSILNFLPFKYIYQFPLNLYIGKTNGIEIAYQMGIQLLWVVGLFVVFYILQKRINKKVMVQGG